MLEHIRRRRDDAAELRAQIQEMQRGADASGEPQGEAISVARVDPG